MCALVTGVQTCALPISAVLSFASPAAAQSMDHSSMPGMTMPVEPKKPVAETVPVPQPQSEPAPMPEMDHGICPARLEDRRVGKERVSKFRFRGSPYN